MRCEISSDIEPKIKPGVYQVAFLDYHTQRMFQGKAHKLQMRFNIATLGEYHGITLSRWYNVQNVAKKRTKGGTFKAGAKSDFLREYLTLFPRPVKRRDRIAMSPYSQNIIEAQVGTVTHARGKPIPEPLQYSVIQSLLRVVE